MKNFIQKIFLIFFGLLAAILFMELFLRAFYPQSQYSVIYSPWGLFHNPNARFVFYDERPRWRFSKPPLQAIPIHYNSKGLRD